MNKRTSIRILAAFLALLSLLFAVGCGRANDVSGSDQSQTDEQAAKQTLLAYFDSFSANDADALMRLSYSTPVADYYSKVGYDEAAFKDSFQASIDSIKERYGEGFSFVCVPDSISMQSATQEEIDRLNTQFGIAEGEPTIDRLIKVTSTVYAQGSDGKRFEDETGTMYVYRYDETWFIYSAG